MNLKIGIFLSLMTILNGCTEFAMLSSIGGVAVSHNAYAKAYSGMDFLTIINTEKDIKTHIYETVRHDD
jgi:hypothetical protein